MRRPETAAEIWLAIEGWNQIDPGMRAQKIKVYSLAIFLCGVAILAFSTFLANENKWVALGTGLFAVGMGVYGLFFKKDHLPDIKLSDTMYGPLSSGGKELLREVLVQVVGPNNTLDRVPGQDPPLDSLSVQGPLSAALSDEEVTLLESLAEAVLTKKALLASGDHEPPMVEFSLIGALRCGFTLLAEMQRQPAKRESLRAKLRQMTEMVGGFPTEWDKENPESVEVIRRFYTAWTKFKEELLED